MKKRILSVLIIIIVIFSIVVTLRLIKLSGDVKNSEVLLTAARNDEKYKLMALAYMGADINVKDKYGMTPLMNAAGKSNFDVVNFLKRKGARTDFKYPRNFTLLMEVARKKQANLVKELLAEGADINEVSEGGETALVATLRGVNSEDMVELLIQNGADVNLPGWNGYTPILYVAESYPNLKILDLLINAKANVNYQNKYGLTALMLAVEANNRDVIIKLLEAGADINIKDHANNTAIYYAKTEEMKNFLIEKGANESDAIAAEQTKALFEFARTGMLEEVKKLLVSGVNANARDNFQRTPLMIARNLDVVKELVKHGADINAVGSYRTVLMHQSNDADIVDYLIKQGADVHKIVIDGRNVLHHAVNMNNSYEVCKVLLRAGVDPSLKDVNGNTPAQGARMARHYKTYQLLLTAEEDYKKAKQSK